jgi:hypothetical protein
LHYIRLNCWIAIIHRENSRERVFTDIVLLLQIFAIGQYNNRKQEDDTREKKDDKHLGQKQKKGRKERRNTTMVTLLGRPHARGRRHRRWPLSSWLFFLVVLMIAAGVVVKKVVSSSHPSSPLLLLQQEGSHASPSFQFLTSTTTADNGNDIHNDDRSKSDNYYDYDIDDNVTTTIEASRGLQLCDGICDRYNIGESVIKYSGVEVKMTFPVNDLVPDNTIEIYTYSDQDCSVDITGNDYLVPTTTYDDNPDPTGEKNRDIEVVYVFDPQKIQDKDVWVERANGNEVYLSFCMTIGLMDKPVDEEGARAMARLDTLVFIQVEFEGGFGDEIAIGPGDRLDENAQEIYLVDGYWCDNNNTRITVLFPLLQGQSARVCVEPRPRA